ncbi:hypothetical protein Aab01nite_47910 [Paractinoplanes abujensis]|uniref:Uncharacterized protein n=1 Tax=Paractinoplanes abujensis TaxID=882441 RepID=A0A7W7CL17_9ACTN|nr:hypothetical protein [Actinoplanes abujensis]MBB4690437.1 hypothetical protein [Actinoplanes abujensis]GID21201.1 hypothetical protein Aab01nite_47910 [Actinoplanes abujensis]
MSEWIVVPCLLRLRDEFDRLAPHRRKGAEGTIGDADHEPTSDHTPDEDSAFLRHKDPDDVNEVHALDIDQDLRLPGLSMEAVVQFLLGRCRSGAEQRLRYVIFNRRIWEASNDWRRSDYHGDNPHTDHAHFSASYKTGHEASTASWHLEDIPVALTDDDKKWLSAEIAKQVRGCVNDIWEHNIGRATGGADLSAMGALVTANVRAGALTNRQIPDLAESVGRVSTSVAQLKTALAAVPQ